MVMLSSLTKTDVVISGDGIYHISIYIQTIGECHALLYHQLHMIAPMGRVEMVVERNNFLFNIINKFFVYGFTHRSNIVFSLFSIRYKNNSF